MEYIAYLHKDRKSDFGVSFRISRLRDGGKDVGRGTALGGDGLALHIAAWLRTADAIPERHNDDVANDLP